jgi:carbon-monoxide dehydrogenase small subunit
MQTKNKHRIALTVNGKPCEVDVEAQWTLLHVLRNELRLTGTKKGCGTGECGMCTVIVDGRAVNSCLILAMLADGKEITTIEGLSRNGELHPLQSAFVKAGAIQCGYCTPGLIMSAKALLDKNPHPSEDEVREAISGNLCRCLGYEKNVQAILQAAKASGSERIHDRV